MSISYLAEPNYFDLQCRDLTMTGDLSVAGVIGASGDLDADNITSQGDLFFGANGSGTHTCSAGAVGDTLAVSRILNFGAVSELQLNVEADGTSTGRSVVLPYAGRECGFRCDSAGASNWESADINGGVLYCNYNPLSGPLSGVGASIIHMSDNTLQTSGGQNSGIRLLSGVSPGINEFSYNAWNTGGTASELNVGNEGVFINGQPVSKLNADSFAPVDDSVVSHDLVAGSALMGGMEDASHHIINYDTSGDLGVAAKAIVVDNTLSAGSSFTLHIIGLSALAQQITFTPPAVMTDARTQISGNASFDILANAVVNAYYTFTYTGNDVWVLNSFETPTILELANGSAIAPSLSFAQAPDSGLYSSAVDQFDLAINGVQHAHYEANLSQFVGAGHVVELPDGAVGLPSLYFNGSNTSGLYSSGADAVDVGIAGGSALLVDATRVRVVGRPLEVTIGAEPLPAVSNNVDPTTGVWFGGAGTSVIASIAGVTQLTTDATGLTLASGVETLPNGVVGAPSVNLGDPTSGLYRPALDNVSVACGGAQILNVLPTGATLVAGVATLPAGAVGAPAVNLGDATSGLYRPALDNVSVACGGAQILNVLPTGATLVAGVATLPNGAVGAPSVNLGDATSGLYRSALNNVDVAIAGANVANVSASGLSLINGAVGAPSVNLGDATSGLYRPALDNVSVACGGAQILNVLPTGATLVAGVATLPNGAVGAPSVNLGDATSGLYRSALNNVDVAIAGANLVNVSAGGLVLTSGVETLPNGAVGAPSLNLGDPTSGLYRPALDQVSVACAGAQVVNVLGTGLTLATGVETLPNGAVGAPSLNLGDATSGLYRSALNNVDIACAGANVANYSATGEVITGSVTADDFIISSGQVIPFYFDSQFDVDITNGGSLSVTNYQTLIDTAGVETRVLPNGTVNGQKKLMTMYIAPVGTATITITTAAGGAAADTILLTNADDFAECIWTTANGWRVIAVSSGVTVT